MMLMMVAVMVLTMTKIFAFDFYICICKLPINRLCGRYVLSIHIQSNIVFLNYIKQQQLIVAFSTLTKQRKRKT